MLSKIRKTKIQKEEIIADFIFLLISFIITIIALYIFDIHWNFYPGNRIFPPSQYIFTDKRIYLTLGLIGSIIGFFMIKLFLLGLKEEEILWKNKKNSSKNRYK